MQTLTHETGAAVDKVISRELERSRIQIEQVERFDGEVQYAVIGRLGSFTFT